ncbi:coiled-coil domain-containing protein 22 like protein [Quercus suber]|uniref:Coiled-coil domain-containing protein 22 like protein n=1 Tax=Quercus suber TaxID=58331 RepID=A0AAW0M2H1_QUESU
MEESQEILLNSLESLGISIPQSVSSVKDLNPTTLVSTCAQCLNLLDPTASFPTSLPSDSMADQFKICTDLATRIKNLGFVGDMSFHKFLYPSEEDLYKLIRFLVERLSELSEDRITADVKDINDMPACLEKVGAKLKDLKLKTEVPELSNAKTEDAYAGMPHEGDLIPQKMDKKAVDNILCSRTGDFSKDKLASVLSRTDSTEEVMDAIRDTSGNEETSAWRDDEDVGVFEQKGTFREQSSKIRRYETERIQNQEKVLMEETLVKNSGLQQLEEQLELLRAAAEVALDDKHPIDFYLEQLNEQVDAKKRHLVELELEWEAVRKSLEEKKKGLEESLYATNPEAQEKLQKLREVELELQSTLSEIRERKQDADIERILKETRELQLESNSIQERLHRTYAVVDEMVFREAKKDPVGRQAYILLTSIHETFEQISEKTLATDRVRREMAEHEKKLAAMAARSLNVDKLQADLDAIRKENEYLERRLRDN